MSEYIYSAIANIEDMLGQEYKPSVKMDLFKRLSNLTPKQVTHALKEIEKREDISKFLPAPVLVERIAKSYHDKNRTDPTIKELDEKAKTASNSEFNQKAASGITKMIFSGKFTWRQIIEKCHAAEDVKPGIGWLTCAVAFQRKAEMNGTMDEIPKGPLVNEIF